MQGYKIQPLRRVEIRALANDIRKNLGLDLQFRFPVLEYVEQILPQLDPEYEFRVVERGELGTSHGVTYREDNNVVIAIREDIYERAWADEGRDRGTVAHEGGHYHLHARAPVMSRTFGEQIMTCEDPEWQAKCFQGELLIPRHLVRGMAVHDVAKLCGVSCDAADYQLRLYAQGK